MTASSALAETYLAYVGTYTGPKSAGIHAWRFDSATGVATPLGVVATTANPTFLAIHPDRKYLYAANETDSWQGKPGGYVTAYSIDKASGKLTELSQQSTVGGGPCHLNVDATGKALVAVNYGGGSVASFPIHPDGSLGAHATFIQHHGSSVDPARQKEPHAHSVNLSPDNHYALVCDLGLDQVLSYAIHPATGSLTEKPASSVRLPPGSGPRHLAFSSDHRFAFVNGEMLSTVSSFRFSAAHAELTRIGTVSTLPPDLAPEKARANSTAEVRVHPNGHFVYVSNRGHDSIAVFRHDGHGTLTRLSNVPTGGHTPRNFNFDPTGKWLWAENQGSDSILIFSVDGKTGELKPTGQTVKVGQPVCVRFVKDH
jgi:6-phosphogluconolactonase